MPPSEQERQVPVSPGPGDTSNKSGMGIKEQLIGTN